MSHHIYKTEGIILSSYNTGEANKFFKIFTKDFGIIDAMAQGVREVKSKLRYSLQDFSYLRVDLVRGKEIWRLTNAERIYILDNIFSDEKKKKLVAQIYSLLRRLLAGQERNEELFNELITSLKFLSNEELSKKEMVYFEMMFVLRILHNLGYWEYKDEHEQFLKDGIWNREILVSVEGQKSSILSSINKSIRESQL